MSLIGLCFGTGTTSASFQEGGRRDSWNEELGIAYCLKFKMSISLQCMQFKISFTTVWVFVSLVSLVHFHVGCFVFFLLK